MKLLVTAGLSDYKLTTKLVGLAHSPKTSELILIRRYPLHTMPKLRNINPCGIWARFKIPYEIWRFATLLRIVRKDRCNAIVGVQLVLHGLQAALVGWLTETPSVLSVIGDDVHMHMLNRWKRPFLRWAALRASAITVMGPRSRQILSRAGVQDTRMFDMQNFQDEERFRPDKHEKRWDLLFVGDLIPLKRVHALLSAVAEVRKVLTGIRLGILGDGPELQRLQRMTKRLGLVQNVDFLGNHPDVENYLHRSRSLILVSRSEALPAAAVEAMFCGLPVILTDIGDIRSVFNENNALLVPLEDEESLVKAIVTLLTDEKAYQRLQRGTIATRRLHATQWGVTGQIEIWEDILSHCCQNERLADRET